MLTPATILGTPTEAELNQKNSTSLTLGTQTAFDFLRPASAGVFFPKCSMALAKMCVADHKICKKDAP
jgi:hypothetical protein